MIYHIAIRLPDDLDAFRAAARRLLAAQAVPADVTFSSGTDTSLFSDPLPDEHRTTAVPRSFVTLATSVACHRDPQRWSLLYQALWRIDNGEHKLLEQTADPLTNRLHRMAAIVRRDQHRMTAFVRFRSLPDDEGEQFIAFYQPQHLVLRRTASFFIDRFAGMRFSILTPDLTLHWDRETAHFAPGMSREDAPPDDAVEDWWRRYYAAIFNPARANPGLTQRHMPKKFWRDLPEAQAIPDLVSNAAARTDRMLRPPAKPALRPAQSLPNPCFPRKPGTTQQASADWSATHRPRSESQDTPARRPP